MSPLTDVVVPTDPMSLRLLYFEGRGRAEIARLLFAFGGLDFDDVVVSFVRDLTTFSGLIVLALTQLICFIRPSLLS